MRKIQKKLTFPEYLRLDSLMGFQDRFSAEDLRPAEDMAENKFIYHLDQVIVHSGSATSGHYVQYNRKHDKHAAAGTKPW